MEKSSVFSAKESEMLELILLFGSPEAAMSVSGMQREEYRRLIDANPVFEREAVKRSSDAKTLLRKRALNLALNGIRRTYSARRVDESKGTVITESSETYTDSVEAVKLAALMFDPAVSVEDTTINGKAIEEATARFIESLGG